MHEHTVNQGMHQAPTNLCSRRQVGHERGRGIAGIVLLDEADCRVDDEKADDPHKVLPVRSLTLKKEKRVPHEADELENLVLLPETKMRTSDEVKSWS